MKIKPILFSAAMVHALQNGSKTQTRRLNNLKAVNENPDDWEFISFGSNPDNEKDKRLYAYFKMVGRDTWTYCLFPYGAVGDILWVRETWAETTNVNNVALFPNRFHVRTDGKAEEIICDSCYIYRADGEWQWCDDDGFSTEKSYWKPSIFMPKAACRIFLKITGVRAERLQSISGADAIAEGVVADPVRQMWLYGLGTAARKEVYERASVRPFKTLWQSINGPESWDANPWVWVVTFERCEKPEGFV